MPSGITEAEISEALNLERRTVNNYLREMAAADGVYKNGRHWYTDEPDELDAIRDEIVSAIDKLVEYLKRRQQ